MKAKEANLVIVNEQFNTLYNKFSRKSYEDQKDELNDMLMLASELPTSGNRKQLRKYICRELQRLAGIMIDAGWDVGVFLDETEIFQPVPQYATKVA